jgi:hypothetical protein
MTRRILALHPLVWLTPGALLLRLLMFAGRGDYIAFDEGWYLLLGRSLMGGDGFSLSGLRHATLSPLFPMLAGAMDVLIDNIVWSGRIVAAVAAGLLVIPCWSIFRRIAGQRTATLSCVIVIAMPALAPFVVPYWVGRDLWVGAEPLLHLFLFSGIALALRAREKGRLRDYAWGGAMLGAAYLARPEAILIVGALGLMIGAAALIARRPSGLIKAALLGLAFGLVAAPYWVYLHDVLGRWTVTGRGVPSMRTAANVSIGPPSGPTGPTATIEQMLWGGDASAYVQRLYSLDASGTRLASDYWGSPRAAAAPQRLQDVSTLADVPMAQSTSSDRPMAAQERAQAPPVDLTASPRDAPATRVQLYARALGTVIPWYMWPFVAFGALARRCVRRRPRIAAELLLVGPLLFTSVAIARVVAIDPRTQLFLLPLVALYAARGLLVSRAWLNRALRRTGIRRGFAGAVLTGVVLLVLAGTQARWLYMSLGVGSPHHLAGSSNREIGRALAVALPADAVVTSWHPAIALYADRDWRVLPSADLPAILRYADAVGSEWLVISRFYPGPDFSAETASEHALIRVPRPLPESEWRLELQRGSAPYLIGRIASTDGG